MSVSTARTGQRIGPDTPIPDKLYFKIGEVSQLVGVRAHVLRYWEKEISSIRPSKSASNQRRYRRKDAESFRESRRVRYEERYTLAGARKRLLSGGKATSGAGHADLDAAPEVESANVASSEPAIEIEEVPQAGSRTDTLTDDGTQPAAPQLDLAFALAADAERLERVKAGLRELIRLAEES